MNQKSSKLRNARIYLLFFILFCSLFPSENAFSQKKWKKGDMTVTYNQKEGFIIFDILLHHYFSEKDQRGNINWCELSFSDGGTHFNNLISVSTREHSGIDDIVLISMFNKRPGEIIEFINSVNPEKGTKWTEETNLNVDLKITDKPYKDGRAMKVAKEGSLIIKWYLSDFSKSVKYVKIIGQWVTNEKGKGNKGIRFGESYKLNIKKLISNATNNTPLVYKQEISTKMKVSKNTDAINLSGVESGENIKVYTLSGVEVKSVVATDDVVNIKLSKNQKYIIKAGKSTYKVAL